MKCEICRNNKSCVDLKLDTKLRQNINYIVCLNCKKLIENNNCEKLFDLVLDNVLFNLKNI